MRDVWNISGYSLPEDGLKNIRLSGFSIFLDDSPNTHWRISPSVLQNLKSSPSDGPVLLVRHHVPVREMVAIANSIKGYPGTLPDMKEMASKLPAGMTVISGDTGASLLLPRVACLRENDVTFIASSLGNVKGDAALVLHESTISQIPL